MKNIEKGCAAIIVRSDISQNLGISVTVGGYLGNVYGYEGGRRWTIDRKVYSYSHHRGLQLDATHVKEDQLMRIDDFEESHDHARMIYGSKTDCSS